MSMEYLGASGDNFVLRVDGVLVVGEFSAYSKWVKIDGHKLVHSKFLNNGRAFEFSGKTVIAEEHLAGFADMLRFAYDHVIGEKGG